MIASARWWRIKPSPFVFPSSGPKWLQPGTAYPGIALTLPAQRGKVRLYCDLEAFRSETASLSLEVPIAWLDEMESPAR